MKPLQADPSLKAKSWAWHQAVFKKYGTACYFCGTYARDSMHIIPANLLGPLAYDLRLVENGRPGCRRCHEEQHGGLHHFKHQDRITAIRAHNAIAKVPLAEPF